MKCTVFGRMLTAAALAATLQMAPGHAQSAESRPAVANPAASSAVTPDQLAAWLHHIAAELRALRAEMLQLRLDAQEVRVSRIEQEIQKVRQKQADLQDEEEHQRQQIAEAAALASQPLDAERHNQLETIRAELAAGSGDRFRNERAETVRAEEELTQRLQREKAQYEQMQALLTQIVPGAAKR